MEIKTYFTPIQHVYSTGNKPHLLFYENIKIDSHLTLSAVFQRSTTAMSQ